MKADVDLKIPPKKEVLVYCPMSSRQLEMYRAIVDKTIVSLVTTEEKPETLEVDEKGRSSRKRQTVDYRVREAGRQTKKVIKAKAHHRMFNCEIFERPFSV